MKSIGETVIQRANIVLKNFDPISSGGYTLVPNAILKHKELSSTAKLIYSMMLYYAREKNNCYPGQIKLGADIGASKPTIIKGIKELEKVGYLKTIRRGQGKTNIYHLYAKVQK